MSATQEPTRRQIINRHINNGQLIRGSAGPSEEWRAMPELPTAEELMGTNPPIVPTNDTKAPYISKAQYLETQYRQYRCEGIHHLRVAISRQRNEPRAMEGTDFHIYTQVHVQGYFFTHQGAACRVSFSTERSPAKILWDQCSRLTPGAVVVLSPKSDNFATKCFVATVAYRKLQGGLEPDPEEGETESTPPRIDIFWADAKDAIIDPSEEMVMLEANGGFYEAVRYAMVGLQHEASNISKFDKYLINGSKVDREVQYLDEQQPYIPPGASHLDDSQREAFQRMTRKELAIIQGPPGTGKTFTSVIAIESLMRTLRQCREGYSSEGCAVPIVVSAQTNHALDQILEHCIASEAVVARLGRRTESEIMKQRFVSTIRYRSKAKRSNKLVGQDRQKIITQCEKLLKMCFPEGLVLPEDLEKYGVITPEQLSSLTDDDWTTEDENSTTASPDSNAGENSLTDWLVENIVEDRTYVYYPPKDQAEPEVEDSDAEKHVTDLVEDPDAFEMTGHFVATKLHLTGAVPLSSSVSVLHQGAYRLKTTQDLYHIPPQHRGAVYRHMRNELVAKVSREIQQQLRLYENTCSRLTASRWENTAHVLKYEGIQIIGCTTTGLTKYRGLISAIKPKVLLVEEAAETREANITSALYPSLDQLVLVGDHQQLVPHVDVRFLAGDPFNLNVSLFERLVGLDVPFTMLKEQRRMIPALRRVVQTFYKELRDHQSVLDPLNRPPVPGMGGRNLWWFPHDGEQSRDSNMSSVNHEEAMMVADFAVFLMQKGVPRYKITILTYYRGQKALLERLLRYRLGDKRVAVRTVDSYQGEENDVILLSLVRSMAIGFMEDVHRATVAISRARRGLYIFGNARLQQGAEEQVWTRIAKSIEASLRAKSAGDEVSRPIEAARPVVAAQPVETARPEEMAAPTPFGGNHGYLTVDQLQGNFRALFMSEED